MDSGLLYVIFNKWITDPETNEMPYKIGITRNTVADRYYGLGLKMPGKFETLFAYKIKDCAKAEQSIHAIFDNYCVNGEWFNLNNENIEFIKQICEKMGGKLVTDEINKEIKNETELETIEINRDKKYNIEYGNELEFLPDKETFRKRLLKVHSAKWTILYSDGRTEEGIWEAKNITESSNIIGNIRSGYLRNWRQKGIIKATFEVKDL